LEGSKTLEIEFLGEKARFPTGPFYLAMKYGIPVSFVFAMKERKSHYHFYATPPKHYIQQGNMARREEILRKIIQDYVSQVEQKLIRYPEQWFNYYNFWG
jgi:predicted LPLAT superfamily acyltransferase